MLSARRHRFVFAGFVLFVFVAVTILTPTARAEPSAWIGEKPTDPLVTYPDEGNGNITISNKFAGNGVSSSVAVEVYQFKRDDPSGMNEYKIGVLGIANSRGAHKYSASYFTNRIYSPCGYPYTCTDSGITGDDMGKWFDLPTEFYHYGRAYRRIFVCSNGWLSFLIPATYTGTSCDYAPIALPTADTKDANGNRIDGFDSIVAPLWRDLNPSGGGKIRIGTEWDDICGFRHFAVFWEDVPNFGNGYRNNFAVDFWRDLGWGGDGQICPANPPVMRDFVDFAYGSVSPTDPTTSTTKIGVEDPTGVIGFEIPASTPATYGLVRLEDPGASGGSWLASSRIHVNKQSASNARLDFEKSLVAGYNVRTSNPPNAADGTYQAVATAVEVVGVAALCAFLGLELGCVAIDLGVAITPDLAKTLAHPSEPPPSWQDYPIAPPGTTGFLEAPVRDERGFCGGGVDCDVDMAVYDQLSWKVPKDSAVHVLEIQFGVRMGSRSSASDTWYWTGVVIRVAPSGTTLFDDDLERNPLTPGTDPADTNWLSWTTDGLWHMSGTQGFNWDPNYRTYSARYGKEGTNGYNTGSRNSGSLTGPLFNVRSTGNIFCYRSWWDTETGTAYDKKLVQTSVDRGKTWSTLHTISEATDPRYAWVLHSFSLDGYVGKEALVRFFFDTVDGALNDYTGWYIDTVSIVKSASCPVKSNTISYFAHMAWQNDGVAKARASGGASCSVTAARNWEKFYDDGSTRKFKLNINFANYQYILGQVWVDLEAPGIADEAYFRMDVYHDSTPMGTYSGSNGGDNWEGYKQSDQPSIGTTGVWKYIVTVWGLDWGSQTCSATGEFYVYDL